MRPADKNISEFLTERIAAGDFPSAVYLIAEKGEPQFADALGNAVVGPQLIPAALNTIYDLASLTKPLITGLLLAIHIERQKIELDRPVSDYLPEFEGSENQAITVRQLATHCSGLPAWRPLYLLTHDDRSKTIAAIAGLQLEYAPGTRVVYSDLGFIVLGFLLERVTNKRFAELAEAELFQPLGLQQTFFNPQAAQQTGIAACETGNLYERQMCEIPEANTKFFRNETIWGQVHDGNAYFLGGAAGHAGLFSTANETLQIALQFSAAHSRLLEPETCELFKKNMTEGLEEARSLGWQLAQTKDSAAGLDLPPNSFGHSGFTGTSCWNDADHDRIFILLTNRTHARKLPFANINSVRRKFHSLASAALNSRMEFPSALGDGTKPTS